jgi:activator of HSP90 ATPase
MASKKKKKAAKKTAPKKKPAKKKPAKKKPAKKKAAAPKKKAAPPKAKKKQKAAPAKARVADVNKVAKIGPKPTTTIVQHVFIQATPEQVFDAYVQPAVAASIIGGECTGDAQVGASFSQWNGYINGKHLELVRGERVVQEWTTTEWPKGAAPSRVELQLSGTGGGTELTMTHSAVPSEQAEDYRQGWIDYYWTPMRAHFGG